MKSLPKNSSLPRWNEITGIFGGRFDPPHLGHREAVRGVFKNPGIKQVLIIPAALTLHKKSWATAEQRAEMARLNFQSTPSHPFPSEIEIDLRELQRAQKNPSLPSYSYDTLLELRPIYGEIAFIIGTDQLIQLEKWNRFPHLLTLCHWIILQRPPLQDERVRNEQVQRVLKSWTGSGLIRLLSDSLWQIRESRSTLLLAPTDAPAIASTPIRETLSQTGKAPEGSLLPEVSEYLIAHKLYGI
jgi:nicotinate-nucleotide adenylyltransferase